MGPLGKDKMDTGRGKHQFSLVFEIPRKILGKEKATLEGQTGTAYCYFNTAICKYGYRQGISSLYMQPLQQGLIVVKFLLSTGERLQQDVFPLPMSP